MSKINKRYFIGEGERAAMVVSDGLALANLARKKRSAYLKEIGADGFWERRNQAPFAVVIYAKDGKRLGGFLPPERHSEDGKKFWIYRPDGRTTIGKNVLAAFRGLATFNFSDYACDAFGVAHSAIGTDAASRSGMSMYSSGAGYVQKTLVFCIPFGGDKSNKDPTIPADLREIKRSECIALTEEGQS